MTAPFMTARSAENVMACAACVRWRFFQTALLRSFVSIAFGGAIIAGISAALGGAAG
jgi:hypothetical protein